MQTTENPVTPSAAPTPSPTIEQPTLAPIPDSGATDMASGLLSTALSLAFVLALAWLVLRFIKRVQQGKPGLRHEAIQAPQVLHQLSLGPNQRLITVQYEAGQYLLGVTAAGIAVLDVRRGEVSDGPGSGI
jgi:flagellar biogenesis protein FliO